VAHYLGCAVANLTLTLAPEMVILGGGVMQTKGLLKKVEHATQRLLKHYVPAPTISLPELGEDSALIGALALARRQASSLRER
jgi:fructokinase